MTKDHQNATEGGYMVPRVTPGFLQGLRRRSKPKPPRVYDGSGPSGYSGTSGAQRLTERPCHQVALPVPERHRKTRRIRYNKWRAD